MAKFCMHCGQALEPGAKFCDNCGAKIVDDQSFIGEATSSEVVTGDGPDAADATDEIADTTDDSGFFVTTTPEINEDVTSKLSQPEPGADQTFAEPKPTVTPASAPAQNPYVAADVKPKKEMSKGAVIGISIAVFLVIVLGGAGILMATSVIPTPAFLAGVFGQKQDLPETVDISQVQLVGSSETSFGLNEDKTSKFPIFKISYPAGWTEANDNVSDDSERLELVNADGIVITITINEPSIAMGVPKDFKAVAKANFKPGKLLDGEMPNIGNMVVARGYNEQLSSWEYALLPEKAISENPNTEHAFIGQIPPAFSAGNAIAVYCTSSEALDEATEQQVVAIIASFVIDDSVKLSDGKKEEVKEEKKEEEKPVQQIVNITTNGGATTSTTNNSATSGSYVFPNSSSSYLSTSDLQGLDAWTLAIGRNEIYARHGYNFQRDIFANYFASQPWYTPQYAKGAFDDSVLNDFEIKNINLIHSYEESIGSPYL